MLSKTGTPTIDLSYGTVPISFPVSASCVPGVLLGLNTCGCRHRPIGGKLIVGSVMVLVATSLLCGPSPSDWVGPGLVRIW